MAKKLGVLFSGGKDSTYAAYLAKKTGYKLTCLMTVFSENQESYMFHTPSINKTKKQAEMMNLPFLTKSTKGEKEAELKDLEELIKQAISEYKIEAISTGALHSDYQAKRIQKICDNLKIKCFNPLWHKDEIQYLKELLENDFNIIIIGIFAYPLTKDWLGKKINKEFIGKTKELKEKYQIHPAGEGGEFETFVLDCPLFKKPLKITSYKDSSTGKYSWKREIEVEVD